MFVSAHSTLLDTEAALRLVLLQLSEKISGPATFAVVFTTIEHASAFEQIAAAVTKQLGTQHAIGCTAETVVANEVEYEGEPCLVVWAAQIPNMTVVPIAFEFQNTPGGPAIRGWPEELATFADAGSTMLLLGEPFTFPTDLLLEKLRENRPALSVFGGMASAAQEQGRNRLLLGSTVHKRGAVALFLHAEPACDIEIMGVVSQGCRPIGPTFIVTKGERNSIEQLAGKPALLRLQEVFAELSETDQALARRGLHVGCAMSEYRDEFERGDFLIRNVVGAEPETGSIAIAGDVRVGQTVRFHLRDAATADEDLRTLLTDSKLPGSKAGNGTAQAALLFTCNGRGTRLFPEPNHDAETVSKILGKLPVAGLFAMGEIGPVGGQNYVHGFTASIAVFRAK
jgi:small ligand-binding sensory domain FIST